MFHLWSIPFILSRSASHELKTGPLAFGFPRDAVNVKTRALTVSGVVPWLRSREVRELPLRFRTSSSAPFAPS